MTVLSESPIGVDGISPETLALQKNLRYNLMMMDIKKKVDSYAKLVLNNFNLANNDEAWAAIDESPEFYKDPTTKDFSHNGEQFSQQLIPFGSADG